MKQTKITYNLSGLDEFKKVAGNSYRARVGIIGDKAAQDHVLEKHGERQSFRTSDKSISNAEIGVIQMFGSITNNIPPRDFLLMPIQKNQAAIIKGMNSGAVKAAIARKDIKKVFQLLGLIAEGIVQQAFETSGFGLWAPNKPSTVDRKGSSRPLIDTGQLRRAISSDVVKASATGGAGGRP